MDTEQGLRAFAELLKVALDIRDEQANSVVSFIQEHSLMSHEAVVTVGPKDIIVPPGQLTHVKCKVPADLDFSEPVVLFESGDKHTPLTQLDIGEGLMEIEGNDRPYVKVPLSNLTASEVTIHRHTPLGRIQPIVNVIQQNREWH
ncbi:hypothetical protein QQF64_002833 [Cirrhinus molitorella]|uniref:Uncharacterized protein n=1 Tax=Cirrhinus molitorella TaxID=172907 RepID=A0ABR3MRA4_9TELE